VRQLYESNMKTLRRRWFAGAIAGARCSRGRCSRGRRQIEAQRCIRTRDQADGDRTRCKGWTPDVQAHPRAHTHTHTNTRTRTQHDAHTQTRTHTHARTRTRTRSQPCSMHARPPAPQNAEGFNTCLVLVLRREEAVGWKQYLSRGARSTLCSNTACSSEMGETFPKKGGQEAVLIWALPAGGSCGAPRRRGC
jgi:hypothetical protein